MSFLKDLITLDVITVSGSIAITSKDIDRRENDDEQPQSIIDFDEMFKRIQGKVTTESNLKIIAATRINIDKDTYNFVAEDLGEAGKELAELHFQSVDMASKARAEIVARLKPNFTRKKDVVTPTT